MTVIRPNAIAGINSITIASGAALAVHKADGTLIQTLSGTAGVSTFTSISVGSATTSNSAAKSINIGLGASIAQHNDNTLTLGTNGDPRITIDASGNFNVGSAATIKAGGNATFSGIVTATSFKGDGSGLSGISAGTSLSGSTDNTICTVTGANAIQGESNLTFDGSALAYSAGGAERFNLAHTSGGIVALKNPSNSSMQFGTNNTTRMTITSSGGVGIGTESPDFEFTVADASGAAVIRAKDGANSKIVDLIANSTGGLLRTIGSYPLVLNTNQTERLRIGPSGGVGISTDKIRNADFLHIATLSQDFTNPTEELMDGGGICFQTIDNLAATGRSFPGIFWAPNTNELGRVRAGIIGVAASNNDATDIVFLGKYLPGGDGMYPRDERMRIRAQTGYVGINTATPGRHLHIVGTDGPTQATVGNSDTILVLDNKGTNGAILEFLAENTGAGRIMFTDTDSSNQGQIEYTHSDDMMDIQSAGGFAVHVAGSEDAINASANGAVRLYYNNALKVETGSSHVWFYSDPLAANTSFNLGNSSSGRWGTMFSTATNVSSDISLKNSIATSDLGLDFINNLLPKSYKWNDTNLTQNPTYGLIAQDVQEALTKAGKTSDDFAGLDIPENGDPCGLDYLQFIAPLVKAVQELSTEVETLKTKVAALEGG